MTTHPKAVRPSVIAQRGCMASALIGLMMVTVCACTVLTAMQLVPGVILDLPIGYGMEMCLGVNYGHRLQAGLAWSSPYLSVLPGQVFFWANHVCGFVPWLPILPPRGEVVFPP